MGLGGVVRLLWFKRCEYFLFVYQQALLAQVLQVLLHTFNMEIRIVHAPDLVANTAD
jgi:hypothetical protein